MLTALGRLIRKHRIDRGLLLKHMAEAFGVSSAYLSAIETGDKPFPKDFVQKVIDFFALNKEQAEEMIRAAEDTLVERRLDLPDASPSQLEVAAMFARKLPKLENDTLMKIRKILEEHPQ